MTLSQSSRTYLERKGRLRTLRLPTPLAAPGLNAVHTYPVEAPLPLPELSGDPTGSPTPDIPGLTLVWPHGE